MAVFLHGCRRESDDIIPKANITFHDATCTTPLSAMSNTARALLITCIVMNCVLWSQSRYAQDYHRETALWKRIPSADTRTEVQPLLSLPDPAHVLDQCRPLDLQLASDQCIHVQDLCPTSETVLSIPYLRLYFCADPPVRPFMFTALLLWLLFLFSTLGISASDFFTPNLAAIAQFLRLGEDVAGVTLLAFGNASPDVFATFSAMRTNSGSLAIGELLGAATFIVSCVVGSMCIIRPFKVDRIPFLRDVSFFTVAICMLLFILRDGTITALESAILVVWYVVYAFTVVVGGWWVSRREKKRRIEAIVRAEYMDENQLQPYSDGNPFRTCISSCSLFFPRRITTTFFKQHDSPAFIPDTHTLQSHLRPQYTSRTNTTPTNNSLPHTLAHQFAFSPRPNAFLLSGRRHRIQTGRFLPPKPGRQFIPQHV